MKNTNTIIELYRDAIKTNIRMNKVIDGLIIAAIAGAAYIGITGHLKKEQDRKMDIFTKEVDGLNGPEGDTACDD